MTRPRSLWLILILLAGVLALVPVLAVRADLGLNWTAIVYDGVNTFSGTPAATFTGVNGIDFNWGNTPPTINGQFVNSVGNDQFSILFSSVQTIVPGTYRFVVTADDGVEVRINGAVVYSRLTDAAGGAITYEFTQTIVTTPTTFEIRYYENTGDAVIKFEWFLQGVGAPTPFGTPFIPTVVATPVPALTVEVQNVRGLAVRTGPYLGASLVTVARPGTQYVPIARSNDEGGPYTWYLITVGDKTGWASGRYLKVTGDPNSVPVQQTIFDQIDNVGGVGATASPRAVMNFRRRPSQRAERIGLIPWGAQTELIGRTVQGGQNFWLQVRYEGKVGWIYAPFVSVSGNVGAVPIR